MKKKINFGLKSLFVDDRLARLAIAVRGRERTRTYTHQTKRFALCNYSNAVAGKLSIQLWRWRHCTVHFSIGSVRAKVRSSVITRICTTWVPIFCCCCSRLIATKQLCGCNIETQSLDTYFVFTAIHFPWVPPTSSSILHSSLSLACMIRMCFGLYRVRRSRCMSATKRKMNRSLRDIAATVLWLVGSANACASICIEFGKSSKPLLRTVSVEKSIWRRLRWNEITMNEWRRRRDSCNSCVKSF